MNAESTPQQQRFYELRNACRKFLEATFEADYGGFDWRALFASEGESRIEILANALATAMMVEAAAASADQEFDGTLIIPNYIGNLHVRTSLKCLTEDWMASDPQNAVRKAQRLMMFARSGALQPVIPKLAPDDIQGIARCKIRAAVDVLGGVTKAALAIGVTPGAINGWIAKGQILNPIGYRLFELAEAAQAQRNLA